MNSNSIFSTLRSEIVRSLVKFASMGIGATIAGFFCYFLIALGLKYAVAFIISLLLGAVLAFLVFRLLTSKSHSKQMEVILVKQVRFVSVKNHPMTVNLPDLTPSGFENCKIY